MDWERILGTIAHRLEQTVDRGRYVVRRGSGRQGHAHIAAYRSFGTPDRVRVRGRVLHGSPPRPATPDDPWWTNLANAYRRLETDEVPDARVRVRFQDRVVETRADEEGHFLAEVTPSHPLPESFWHTAQLELVDPPGAGATARIAIPDRARFGVISDLDDTVVKTDVRNILRMGRQVLFGNAHTRIPFPGVGAFYRALHQHRNPLFYVSSSPWNLYDVLGQFLHLHEIPAGPMELRDWGLSGDDVLPFRHRGHKRAAINRILAAYPGLRFILVGDSGQEDPEIYRDVVHDHPDRVLGIYIRSVVPRPDRIRSIRALSDELAGHDIDLVLADDTLDAARHAATRGWIDAAAVEQVARGKAREQEKERTERKERAE